MIHRLPKILEDIGFIGIHPDFSFDNSSSSFETFKAKTTIKAFKSISKDVKRIGAFKKKGEIRFEEIIEFLSKLRAKPEYFIWRDPRKPSIIDDELEKSSQRWLKNLRECW